MTTLDNNNLKRALIQAFEEELQEIETTSAKLPHDFSDDFLTRMDSVTKMSNHKYSTIFSRRIRRSSIGAIAAMLILCMSITVYAVIKNIPINMTQQNGPWNLITEGSNDPALQASFKAITPSTPEGFHVDQKVEEPLHHEIHYTNDSGKTIIYSQAFADDGQGNLNVPNDGSNTTVEDIDGRSVIVTNKGGIYSLVTENGTSVFLIAGDCDYDILLNMVSEVISIE